MTTGTFSNLWKGVVMLAIRLIVMEAFMRKTIKRLDNSVSTDPAKEVEVFPGIHERRYFLRGSLATVAAVIALNAVPKNNFAQTSMKATGVAGADKLLWDDFIKQSVPIAQQLIADPAFSVDEYLYRIGSLATRLKEIPNSQLGSYKTVDPRVWFGPSFRGSPFFIIQWRMEPGAVLPPHNHPNASVCTLGFEGEVRLRNFEIIEEAPDYASKKTFRVRETRSETLSAGRINTLAPARDNIHCFKVGKAGARGIDINTLHGKINNFSFLDMSEQPIDSEKRIFEAVWNPQLGRG
jgi:2-aminoethanethiol dioxygenase/cysteine oxidase family protein